MINNHELLRYNRERSGSDIAFPHLKKTMTFALATTAFTEYYSNSITVSLATFLLIVGVYCLFRSFYHFITDRINAELTQELFSKDLRLNSLINYISSESNKHIHNPVFGWEELLVFRGLLNVVIVKNDITTLMFICEHVFHNKVEVLDKWFYLIIIPCIRRNKCGIDDLTIGIYGRFLMLNIFIVFASIGIYGKTSVISVLNTLAGSSEKEERVFVHLLMNVLHNTPQELLDSILELKPTDIEGATAGALAVEMGLVETEEEFYSTLNGSFSKGK